MTPLPTAPNRNDPTNFAANGDAFLGALPLFVTEANALQTDVTTKSNTASTAAQTASTAQGIASAAANAAQASATATAWVSGTSYAVGKCAISNINYQTYRRIVAGSGTTDPASDTANWTLLIGNDSNGGFVPFAMSSSTIDLSKGSYFTYTASAATTFSIINCPTQGYSFTLEVTLTSGSLAFPSSVKTPGDAVPTLSTGKTHLLMLVTSNTGARWRMTVAPNYTT